MQTIALGRRNPKTLVRTWEEYLRGVDLFFEEADGKFTEATAEATKKWQAQNSLVADGIVGNRSWGTAMADGLHMLEDNTKGEAGPNWPEVKGVVPSSLATRVKLFGQFAFKPAPVKGMPEAIKITDNWASENITRVTVPQLKGVLGAPKSGRVFWHKKASPQLLALFKAWEMAGLLDLVLSWAGSWVPRFVRGSRTRLSNHAWGVAFDINVPWNGLRKTPALVGQHGSVRELVPLAAKLGFYWGGWGWSKGKYDGMHFEVSQLLTEKEIQAVLDELEEDPYAEAC